MRASDNLSHVSQIELIEVPIGAETVAQQFQIEQAGTQVAASASCLRMCFSKSSRVGSINSSGGP